MMRRSLILRPRIFSLCFLAALSLTACERPPKEEIDLADQSASQAINAKAEEYADRSMAAAKALLREAKARVAQKDYKEARALALQASGAFSKAEHEAKENLNAAKAKANQLYNDLSAKLEAMKVDVSKKASSMKARAELLQKKLIINKWEPKLAAAKVSLESGHYMNALDSLEQMDSELSAGSVMRTADKKPLKK